MISRKGRSGRRTAIVLSWVAALAFLRPARAQVPVPGLLPKASIPSTLKPAPKKLKVGMWVEYAVRDFKGNRAFRWRIALVGKQGRRKQWWEHFVRFSRLKGVIVKALVQDAQSPRPKLLKAIWKPLGHQALEVPLDKAGQFMEIYAKVPKQRVRDMGVGTVTVAAGRFQAHHYVAVDARGRTMHFWTNPAIPIFGLVKLLSPTLRMELTGLGTDAVTMVREKPGKWPFPVGGPTR